MVEATLMFGALVVGLVMGRMGLLTVSRLGLYGILAGLTKSPDHSSALSSSSSSRTTYFHGRPDAGGKLAEGAPCLQSQAHLLSSWLRTSCLLLKSSRLPEGTTFEPLGRQEGVELCKKP